MIYTFLNSKTLFEAHFKGNKKKVELVSNSEVLVDDKKLFLDELKVDESNFHLLLNNNSYSIEFVDVDSANKIVSLKVNNKPYDIQVKDKFDLLLSKLGMADLTSKKISDLKAPMPGLVVDVLVEEGQEVKEGDSLLILEAMKMENSLKSPIDGIVKSIAVSTTDTVEKNQVLLSFE